MGTLGFIFTTDYEIFGNGSGCVEKCMLAPTEKMAHTLETAGARLTLFVDLCEYWAFEKEFARGKLKQDWAAMIRRQLQDLTRRGHDVQLHFHPQWLDYQFDGENWQLNYDLWRLSALRYEDATHPERGLRALFARGKQTLEEMLQPVNAEYRCQVFRAGAWSMQPEAAVLRAMRENGFKIDSTVAAGTSFQDQFTYYDFSEAPDKPSWRITDKLLKEDAGGILEVPIFTAKSSLIQKLRFLGIRKRRAIPFKPTACSGSALASAGKSKWQKLKEVTRSGPTMFNFSDASSSEEMIYFAQQALKRYAGYPAELVPVVAISHPKTFANAGELERFLNWSQEQNRVKFITYQTLIDE